VRAGSDPNDPESVPLLVPALGGWARLILLGAIVGLSRRRPRGSPSGCPSRPRRG